MNIYKSQFNRVIKKAIKKKAESTGLPSEKVQFLMRLFRHEEYLLPRFNFMISHKPEQEDVEIADIVGKLDLFNVADLVPPFVLKSLSNMCASYSIADDKIAVMVILDNDNVRLFLYNGATCVKELSDEDIFSDEVLQELAQESVK